MNITKQAIRFRDWFNSEEFPKDLEKASVDECVLAWADYTETDLKDNFESVCEKIVELGIC